MQPKVQLFRVTSANISHIGWRENTLYVAFCKGGVYAYADVSLQDHEALVKSDSFGKHFHAHIKPRFTATKLASDASVELVDTHLVEG